MHALHSSWPGVLSSAPLGADSSSNSLRAASVEVVNRKRRRPRSMSIDVRESVPESVRDLHSHMPSIVL
jgi:hypothetical protein